MGIKNGLKSVLIALSLTFGLGFSEANSEVLKTMNVSMPTNYGTFLGEIHYSEKNQAAALKVERIIREDLIKVINYFEYVPHDVVHFNLDPYMRLTNGNARTFPTNIINLYNFPANNREHLVVMENWMQGLVLHEFVHITHLDQTRDYLEVGRKIFGTIAKVPTGIVPRWFTEGIAVWGESHLINGGRLNNPLFNKELFIQYRDHNFCKTIDCLDDPGVYPQGQLSYWAGAHFIEYLENKKPKTIKCLVESNSYALPFLLNNAFKYCAGDTAQDLYEKFREEYMNAEPAPAKAKAEWGEGIKNAYGADDFQKGFVLDGDRLFKLEAHRFSEALVAYDLKDNVSFVNKYDLPISDISAMVDIDNENRMLLVSFADDPRYREHNKTWKLVNPDTLLVERTLNFPHDPSYVIPLGGESFLTFSYWEDRWIVERNGDLLRAFSANDNLSLVKKVGDRLLLKINDSNGTSSLVLADFKLQHLDVVYKSTNAYDVPVIAEKYLVIREQNELKLLEWDKKPELSSLPADLLNRITLAEFNENRSIVLENGLKTSPMSEKEASAFFKTNKSTAAAVDVQEFKDLKAPTSSFESEKSEDYPRLDHLIPHYWFLTTGTSENLNSIGATTTFSDPMDVHTLQATVLTYPSERKVGGTLDYAQKLVKVSDLWYVTGYFNQEYSKTDFNSHIDLSRDFEGRTYYVFLKRRWTYAPGIFAGKSDTEDFISDRSVTTYGMSHSLNYSALAYDDFFQNLTASFSLQGNDVNNGKSYLSTQLVADGGIRFTEYFTGELRGSYSRLFKSDFARGVVYGGGISDFTRIRTHEFYGLPYSNAFGNEVYAARMLADYDVWDVYRGKNLIPFFLREVHFIFGVEGLHAERIILDDFVLRNKTITGVFAGPRLKLDVAYFVPVTVDLIFSNIANPNGSNVNEVDFRVSASLF